MAEPGHQTPAAHLDSSAGFITSFKNGTFLIIKLTRPYYTKLVRYGKE